MAKQAFALLRGQAEEFVWFDKCHNKNVLLRVTPDRTPREAKIMATYHSLQESLEEFINDPSNPFDSKLVARVKTNGFRGPLELVLVDNDSYGTFNVYLKAVVDIPKITIEDEGKEFLGIPEEKLNAIIAKAVQSVARD